jgi:hypothetical protein
MEIKFADSFGKSLKRLIRHQTWWYKTYQFFRYDIKNFVKNVWHFRKGLWNYRWWDYRFPLEMFKLSIEGMYPKVEKYGLEVDETRLKKVDKMIRACQLLENFMDDNFVDQAEKELGNLIHRDWEFEDVPDKPGYSQLVDNETDEEKAHNRKIFDRAREIEEEQWNELWNIMRGQNDGKSNAIAQVVLSDGDNQPFETKFDGTDLRSWWD